MKSRQVLLAIFFIAFAASASFTRRDYNVSFESTKSSEMRLDFELGNYTLNEVVKDGVTYIAIDLSAVRIEQKGYAEIPFVGTTVQIGDINDYNISKIEGDYKDIKLEYPLLPSRGTLFRYQDPTTIPYEIDPESIVDEWYPKKLAENLESFIFRDTRGTNVYAYPFQYNAATQMLRVYSKMTVYLAEDFSSSTNPMTVRPDYVAAGMSGMYRSLFINYDESKAPSDQLGEFGEKLVIYTARDAAAILPYIEWKREKGFTVHTEQVAPGTRVKDLIQNAYDSNPNILYVQLVGGHADVQAEVETMGTPIPPHTPNSPKDPELGFVAGDDLYNDLIVGRFPANSAAEVTVQVNKVIHYEKNPDLGATWYKNAMGMARREGEGWAGHHGGEGDDRHMEYIRNKLLSYNYTTVHRDYDNNSTYDSNTNAARITERINAGISALNFCNHGDFTHWSVGDYSVLHVNALNNGSKLPFIWSVACFVGKYNQNDQDCLAEAFVKKDGGGAIAFLGSTMYTPWQAPMTAQDYFNDLLIGGYDYSTGDGGDENSYNSTSADKRTTFGALSVNGIILMLSEDYGDINRQNTIKTWTVFGDASVQVRTDTPIDIAFNDMVEEGAYTTTVTSAGQPVENALVSLYRNGNTVSGFTNSLGDVTINHGFSAGEKVTLTVTGYNLATHQSSQTVVDEVGGNFALSTGSLSYGSVSSGRSSSQQFQISNSHATEYLAGHIAVISSYSVSESSKSGEGSKDIKNAVSYAVPPQSSITFDLTFEPTAAGPYNGNISITSSDAYFPTNILSVTGTGIVPEISVPSNLFASSTPGASTQDFFDIENLEEGVLDYSISVNYMFNGIEVKSPPNTPDAYGYRWVDSDDPFGPVYNWIDITGVGTSISLGDDQNFGPVDLGFTFNFYGNDFSTVRICSNGFLSFTSTSTILENQPIPSTSQPNNLLAFLWDDLNPAAGGSIYYHSDTVNNRFIVSFIGVPRYGTIQNNTVQVILYENGSIVYQYQAIGFSTVNQATVGIENADGTIGTQVVHNTPHLKPDLAIQFSRTTEWLSLSKTSGSISTMDSEEITATYDASDLEPGVYLAELTVTSNDPESPSKVIPVTFEVNYGGTFALNLNTLSYGSVTCGESDVRQFQITNSHSTESLSGTITTIEGYTVSESSKSDANKEKNALVYVVGPNSSKTFDLTFEPTAEQDYNGNIEITSSDTENPIEYISVTGSGIVPEISVNTEILSASAAPSATAVRYFDIENLGQGNLNYNISINYLDGKDAKASGGPDAYGYKWKDSDEPDGPVYDWIDIAGVGTPVTLGDDQTTAPIDLGFTFNFYGNDFTTVRICSNGFLSFTSTSTRWTNQAIPNSDQPNNLVAFLWDDLNPALGGGIYHHSDTVNDRFIVSFIDVPRIGNTSQSTVQVILNKDGSIVYQYQSIGSTTINASTVGIENEDGTVGTQVVYNAAYLKPNLAIQFSATTEWLTLDKTSGSVSGSSSEEITATFDASDLEEGVYNAELTITSNDPDNPSVMIPVIFTVSENAGGNFSINTTNISFGNVVIGNNSVNQFQISNSHATEYLIGEITTITGYDVSPASKNKEAKKWISYSVPPQSSETFDLIFEPIWTGEFNGNIVITSSDDSNLTNFLSVTGAGVPMNIELTYSGGIVTLDWTEVQGAEMYYIYSKGEPYGEFALIDSTANSPWSSNFAQDKQFFYITAKMVPPGYEDFVFVQGGTYSMGLNGIRDEELPTHSVTLSSFYIGKYLVTQSEWEYVMTGNTNSISPTPSHPDHGIGEEYPVNRVSWFTTLVFCNRKSIAEELTPVYTINGSTNPADWGEVPTNLSHPNIATWNAVICDLNANGYRLPTEAEWEYAARGGIHWQDGLTFSGVHEFEDLVDYAWYSTNSGDTSHPVGTRLPNQLDIYDMSGNVNEWCWDWYDKTYYQTCYDQGTVTDPYGPSSSPDGRRVARSGSYDSWATFCRVAYRDHSGTFLPYFPSYRAVGFRVVRK